MLAGILNSFSKIIFCWEITRNFSDFFSLLLNSKKFRHSKNEAVQTSFEDRYMLEIQDKKMDFTIRRYTGDLDMFFEVFWKQTYPCGMIDRSAIRTILDLGANIGMASAYFHSCFPYASLYCVEPDPDNFGIMLKNLQPILPKEQLQVLMAAVGPVGQKGSLVTSRFSYNYSIQFNENAGQIEVLDMNAIFKYFDLDGADLIKIDIEGAESFLFENTDWLKKVRYLFIEFHVPEVMARAMEILRANGFSCKITQENEMLLFAVREKTQTVP